MERTLFVVTANCDIYKWCGNSLQLMNEQGEFEDVVFARAKYFFLFRRDRQYKQLLQEGRRVSHNRDYMGAVIMGDPSKAVVGMFTNQTEAEIRSYLQYKHPEQQFEDELISAA